MSRSRTHKTDFNKRVSDCRGFTLLEAIIVLVLVAIIAGFALTSFARRGDAEATAQAAARLVRERRRAAIRLNPLESPTELEAFSAPAITIDFTDLSTTRPLLLDSVSGEPVTRLALPKVAGGQGVWAYEYQGLPLGLPPGWTLATSREALGAIPPIDRAELTTSLGFAANGRPNPQPPPGAAQGEALFWAVYFVNDDSSDARAIAVHSTGLTEVWRYRSDIGAWRGFGDRP